MSDKSFSLRRLDIANVISIAFSSTCMWLMLCVWLDEGHIFIGLAVAYEGNWSVKVTCLPFLSVVGWTFVLTKS